MKLDASLTFRVLLLSVLAGAAVAAQAQSVTPPGGYSLAFDPAAYTVKSITVGGVTATYRAYEDIVYVKFPVDTQFQKLNFYVPTAYYEGKSLGGYRIDTAPIFLPNSVGGYMPGPPDAPGPGRDGGPNALLVALSKGYVVAAPGARGRTTQNSAGEYTGKAPTAIVDLKAVVRYLRANDAVMPGDAERIVSNGTSAGGALSALLGASGNSMDYRPYLDALGAADAGDDVFAVSAYCPITNLDHADAAYEWMFSGVNEVKASAMPGPFPTGADRPAGAPMFAVGPMNADQIANSAKLKAQFPSYVNGLGLTSAAGAALVLDSEGNGTFRDLVKSSLVASAQGALAAGADLSQASWLTITDGVVKDVDLAAYAQAVGRLKMTPAFDGLDLGTGENGLFGTATVDARHFTAFGSAHDTAQGATAEPALVKMMNAMDYIGAAGSTTSKYWRIRHGTADRDTSLAIPTLLAAKLSNSGAVVDFAMPWNRPHSGDYDLNELFAWIAKVCSSQ